MTMKSMGRISRLAIGSAAAVVSLTATTGGAVAVAETPSAHSDWIINQQAWGAPKGDGVDLFETAQKDGGTQYVLGRFNSWGEHLTVTDKHDNGRPSIVKLWVGGSGPAVFYSNGDDTEKDFDLSYDEGQTVYLQACTSDGPNAVCTNKIAKGKS